MPTREDLEGLEYDWLAVDADGHVGFFSTAGGGYAPDVLVQDPTAFDAAIETLMRLPAVSAVTCDLELRPDLTNTWKLVAERGLFAFDSDPNGGPYKLIAAPHTPVLLAALPLDIRVVAERIVLPNVRFPGTDELSAAHIA